MSTLSLHQVLILKTTHTKSLDKTQNIKSVVLQYMRCAPTWYVMNMWNNNNIVKYDIYNNNNNNIVKYVHIGLTPPKIRSTALAFFSAV